MRVLIAASILLVGCNSVTLKSNEATVGGSVSKPDGNGPFPALVLLHGCGGPQPGNALWAAELNKWGYVTIEIDSFVRRGVKEICTDLKRVTVSERVVDAYAALDYLQTLAPVEKDRIGVMGWSYGAMVVPSRFTPSPGKAPAGGTRNRTGRMLVPSPGLTNIWRPPSTT